MKSNSFKKAQKIIEILTAAGHEAYIVGGAVRDLLLERNIHDIDITTSASVEEIVKLFPKSIDIAKKHGTIIVRMDKESFEVTTYRGISLLEDLRHRDFTINAMAFAENGTVIDPFDGKKDLNSKLIRGVDNPYLRLEEDPVRMLRAIRFSSELSFRIEGATFQAIKELRNRIGSTAIERITVEFEKICFGKDIENCIDYFVESKLLEKIEPFSNWNKAIYNDGMSIAKLKNPTELWAFLLFQSGNDNSKTCLRAIKLSNKLISEVELISAILPAIVDRGFSKLDVYSLGFTLSEKAERVRAAVCQEQSNFNIIEQLFDQLPIKSKKELAINGKDILSLTKKIEAKQIGKLLSLTEKAVLQGLIENNKDNILVWLQKEGHLDAR